MGLHVNLVVNFLEQVRAGIFVGNNGIHQGTCKAFFQLLFPQGLDLFFSQALYPFHLFYGLGPDKIVDLDRYIVLFMESGHELLMKFIGFHAAYIVSAFF